MCFSSISYKMALLKYQLFFVNIALYIAVGFAGPVPRDQELRHGDDSYDSKVKNLQEKLHTLQKMLSEIKQYQTKYHKDAITADSKTELSHTTDQQEALRKMAGKLSRESDAEEGSHQLHLLENALERLHDKNNMQMFRDSTSYAGYNTGEDLGRFDDRAVESSQRSSKEESKITEDMIFAILQKLLHNKNTHTRGLLRSESHVGLLRPVIKEGQFGGFHQEALHTVENQLLDDLTKAASNGVSVSDVIKDIQQGSRTDHSWTKRQEIERELDALLRNPNTQQSN